MKIQLVILLNIVNFTWPCFNDLSTQSEAHCICGLFKSTFASLMAKRMVAASDTWFKRVVLNLLIIRGCVLGVACNKPISVISHFCSAWIALMRADLPGSKKESRRKRIDTSAGTERVYAFCLLYTQGCTAVHKHAKD